MRKTYSNLYIHPITSGVDVPYEYVSYRYDDIFISLYNNELEYISAAILYFFFDLRKWRIHFDMFNEADPIRPPEKKGDKPILHLERLVAFLEWINKPEPTPYELTVLRREYNIIKPRKKPIRLI